MKKSILIALCAAMLASCVLSSCGRTPSDSADTTAEVGTASDTRLETESEASTETTLPPVETEAEPETSPEEVTTDGGTGDIDVEPAEEAWSPVQLLFASKRMESVVIRAGEDPSEQYAARELHKYLEKMSIAVSEDGAFPFTIRIDPAVADDGYRITTGTSADEGVAITGGNGRGVIYGVYAFLEEKAKIRFFTPELETCGTKLISLTGNMLMEYEPTFELRHTNWISGQSADWNLKNGMNRHDGLTAEMGGTWTYGAWIHTIGWMTGHGGSGQPCLTDPQNLQNAIAAVRDILAKNPDVNIISVSQNDNSDYCKCESCAAIDEIEGSPSGNIIRFVNAIAADIAEDYPNVVIDTLAYMYSQSAPKVTKPLPNVCVRFAPLLSCFVHAYNDPECPRNLQLAKDIEDWSRICNRLYVWDYTTNFTYFIPTFENLVTIRRNMQFFAEHNVKGMFAQGNDQSPSGEFGELRAYLLAKLMMNPYMTEQEYYTHLDEFLAAYYGEGWRYVRAYIDMTSGKADLQCRGCYGAPLEALDRKYYLAMEDTFDSWWDKTEEMAGARLPYVKRSRLQWRYLKLMIRPNEEDARAFLADISAEGIHWREWRYTSEIGADSNLSRTPDKWIYD